MDCEDKIDTGSQTKHGSWKLIKENIHPGTAGENFLHFGPKRCNAIGGWGGGLKLFFEKFDRKA